MLEWGSAYRWGEHYVLIQGTKVRFVVVQPKELPKLDDQKVATSHRKKMMVVLVFTIVPKWMERLLTENLVNVLNYWLSSVIDKEMRYLHEVCREHQ